MTPCPHRVIDGRSWRCRKLVGGDQRITPMDCQCCPHMAINCSHLRFRLARDGAVTNLYRAACAEVVTVIRQPSDCHACPFHTPAWTPYPNAPAWVVEAAPAEVEKDQPHRDNIIPFPSWRVRAR